MKILDSTNKSFIKKLDNLLKIRKDKIKNSSVSILGIINDVKKNGDKAVLKYEKKFNKNSKLIINPKSALKTIKRLDKKVKSAIDIAFNRIYKFHSLQKFKNISYTDKLKNQLNH